jgi:hypothetical protein
LQEIEEAVQHYIATRDSGTQRRILSRWVVISSDPATDHRKRRRSNEPEAEGRPDQGLEKRLNEIRNHAPDGAPDQAPDQGPNHATDQAPDQAPDRDTNQDSNPDPERASDAASGEALYDIADEEFGEFRRDAMAFFAQRQKKRNQEDGLSKATLTWEVARDAFTALRKGHQWTTENDISKLWKPKDHVTADESPGDISQLQRLGKLHESVLSTQHSSEIKRRLTALLIHHEYKVNSIPIKMLKVRRKKKAVEMQKVVEKEKDWECGLAKPTGLSFATATDALNTAYAWIKFMKAWGLGGLVIPAPANRYLSACPLADRKHQS